MIKRLSILLALPFLLPALPAGADEPLSADDFSAETSFIKTVVDLGEINPTDGDRPFEFSVVNSGNAPLVLTYLHASCGCVRLTYPRHPIAPGDTACISGVLVPHNINPGDFKRNILVRSNARTPQTRLFVIGHVNNQ